MRPLDRLPSIKLKLGILIVAAVVVSAAMSQIGFKYGWPVWLRPIVAACVSLLMVQFLAHGMTSPLRQMADAADAMARGNYGRRVRATSHDEVGDLARAFNSMAADLAELDAERRALIGNAAHELRTPIAGLQATFENLADGVVAATPDVVERLRLQIDRLSHLVTDLLDLSRLESPSTPHVVDDVPIAALLDAALARVTADVAPTDVDVVVTATGSLAGDPELLERLLTNLLRNAVIHGEGRGIEVHAHDMSPAAGRRSVLIRVSDRGPGFAAGDEDHLFERFYRGEDTRGRGRPGAGLGLAISRAIVDQHGGTITAARNEPQGCVVTVVLPGQPATTPRSVHVPA